MERVVLAFSKDDTAQKIKRMLDGSGYEVCHVCHSAAELMRSAAVLDDIFVIMGYKIGDVLADDIAYDLDGTKIITIIKPQRQDMIENENIFPVILPINREDLISAIEMFVGSVNMQRRGVQRTADEEKIIERAKFYLMEKYNMTEEQSHRFLQKKSMDNGSRLTDTAKLILRL